MESPYAKTPLEPVNILLTDNGRILEVGTDSPKISFIPIKLEHRQAVEFVLQVLKEKNWLTSETKTANNTLQYKASIPMLYIQFIESVSQCDLHNDGHLTAYDALKLWHARGLMDTDELDDIMTMFE